jgi:uncharacterized protein (TIGR04222 family)
MNPFEFQGPDFLLFYLGLVVAVLVALVVLRSTRESARTFPQPKLSDPYQIAFLRGGGSAAIESAVVSLVDRNVLDAGADGVTCRQGTQSALFVEPLERSIVEELAVPLAPRKLWGKQFPESFSRYERTLSRLGLLPDAEEKSARVRDTLAAGMFLGVVAGIKIAVGLARGRSVSFLVILGVLSLLAVVTIANPRMTRRGKNVLEDLKTLFQGLKSRADSLTPGRAAAELALMAALFGAAALPLSAFPLREKLFPVSDSSSSGDSGGGSDSGSSCGGGGCGGGCGGCGS